jgi:hypothetical protein
MFVRMCLLSWRPNWIHSFLKTRLLWLPPRVAFFLTSETSVVIARVSVFSFWHHSLSLLRRPLPFRQQHSLSTQKVTRFISLLINPHRPAPFATASCARSEDRALSLSSESQRCNRPASCVGDDKRGQRTSIAASSKADASVSPPPGAQRRPPRCLCGRAAASDPPPRPRSPRRKSSSRWKLITPFYWNSSAVLIFYVIGFCVRNYAHLVYGMQMAAAARAWMYS